MWSKKLFPNNKKSYGDNYDSHLFEQYKLYVDGMEKTSDRRQQANNYFIAINTAFISFIGLSSQTDFFRNLICIKLIFALVGIVICVIFWFLIRSYKQLNTGKFVVIHEIEKHLPIALYGYEWKILEEGRSKSKYYPFSHIELLIPFVFGAIYLVLGLSFFF